MGLSRLKKIDLREYWTHEAYDFTTWLSKSNNLELLSDEVGVEVSLLETEASVGRFKVDMLAEEANTGRKIIIENQLEKTDHDHLGKLITYASGLEANIVIWIVKEALEEHQQAISWLNEHTDGELNFFLIQIELWQIDDSNYAPKINVIAKPNDWYKEVKNTIETTKLTETKRLQLEFWTKLKEYSKEINSGISFRKPYPQHWYDVSFGSSNAHIALTVNTQKDEIACEIYISDSKETYFSYLEHKDTIESNIGSELEWYELPEKKASRIKLTKEFILDNKEKWEEAFIWFIEKVRLFQDEFSKY
ncbi:DUF4268 domain-containing protein [Orenia marismortui]|uniref:Uncharacterized protein DUF4268 n=1 Tax=Orenia marismortui TaxID=46469 RepID=A0A4R8GV87_9FIRM|nr:DUF4268 domain-containing protein [Orenia marismortui]TDX48865.1 uncharacterized protein DUF4268 [Orenia marismortui]